MLVASYRRRTSRSYPARRTTFDSAHTGEHVVAMTPELEKFRRLPAAGSDRLSRAVVILWLLIQLFISCDVRASDINAVHPSLKQIITGEHRCYICRSQQLQNSRNRVYCKCSALLINYCKQLNRIGLETETEKEREIQWQAAREANAYLC